MAFRTNLFLDALFVVTDGMNVMEVVEHIERLVRIRENDSV